MWLKDTEKGEDGEVAHEEGLGLCSNCTREAWRSCGMTGSGLHFEMPHGTVWKDGVEGEEQAGKEKPVAILKAKPLHPQKRTCGNKPVN